MRAGGWAAVALVAAAVGAAALWTRPPDPPHAPEPPEPAGPPPFSPAPPRTPRRAAPPGPPVVDEAALVALAPGVDAVDLVEGHGPEVFPGHVAVLEVRVWRVDGGVVESTYDEDGPVRWHLGREGFPLALDAALAGTRVAGVRLVRLDADQAYGAYGLPARVPAGTGVWVELELVAAMIPPERLPAEGDDREGAGEAWAPDRSATLDYALWSAADPSRPLDDSHLRWFPHRIRPGERVADELAAALDGMRPGGVRVRRVPAAAFGPAGRPPLLPAGVDAVLQVELHAVGP